MSELKIRKIEKLTSAGYQCLKEEDFDGALQIAAELEESDFSAAFEIGAQAHVGRGSLVEAVATLQRGLSVAPDCWTNLQLLGNYLTDLGRYEAAEDAYRQALACEDCWQESIRLDQAILANLRGHFSQAIDYCGSLISDEMKARKTEVFLAALIGLKRGDEALKLVNEVLANGSSEPSAIGYLKSIEGRARLLGGTPAAEIRQIACTALNDDFNNKHLLSLIRDIDNIQVQNGTYSHVLIKCVVSDASDYHITYDVIAKNETEILEIVGKFEDQGSLSIIDVDEMELSVTDVGGVYRRGTRIYDTDK